MSPTADGELSTLRVTPSRIAEVTAGLTPAQARAAPSEGEWSVNEVLAHLRSCADIWGGSIARAAAGGLVAHGDSDRCGSSYERTVLDYAEGLAVHERGHARHIARVVDVVRQA